MKRMLLLSLVMILLFMQAGCSKPSAQTPNPIQLLPEGELVRVGCSPWNSGASRALKGIATEDMLVQIRQCVDGFTVKEVNRASGGTRSVLLVFDYADQDDVYLIFTEGYDGNHYFETWGPDVFYGRVRARYYLLNAVEAEHLWELIYQMAEQYAATQQPQK